MTTHNPPPNPFACAWPGCTYIGLWSCATAHRCPEHAGIYVEATR